MQDPTHPSGKPTLPVGFSLSSLTSHRVVPVALSLPKANSDTYNSLLEAIVRSSDDGVITKNLSSIVTSWNPAATTIFGWEAHEMIGQSLLRLIPPRLHHEEMEVIRRLRAGEHIQHFETVRATREGREINVTMTISPLRNSRGEIIGATQLVRNTTQQRAAERARLHLAAIVESSHDAIISKDLDGIITSWNAAAERLFDYTAAEVLGKSVLLLIPPELLEEEESILAKLVAGQRVESFETVRLRKDGHRIEVSLSVSPILDGSGRVVGASKIVRDISQRKQLEISLTQAEKLAAATRISAELAQQVNNPLEALSNLLYLAREQAADPSRVQYLLLLAETELERMARMTRQALGRHRQSAAEAEANFSQLSETLQQANAG